MYGSTEEKGPEKIPLVKKEASAVLDIEQSDNEFKRNPFGDKNNDEFWKKVSAE